MASYSNFAAMDAAVDSSAAAKPDDEVVLPCQRNRAFLRIAIKNEFGESYANRPYVLSVDGETWDRLTGDDGIVEQEVADTAKSGTLKFWPTGDRDKVAPQIYDLELGAMDPVALETGKDSRLSNLNFLSPGDDGEPAFDHEEAAATFRMWSGLDDGTALDDEAVSKLKLFYDPYGHEAGEDPLDFSDDEDDSDDDEPQTGGRSDG